MIGLQVESFAGVKIASINPEKVLNHDGCLADTPLTNDDRKTVGKGVVPQEIAFEFPVAKAEEGLAEGN
jgi:hypothetical protein